MDLDILKNLPMGTINGELLQLSRLAEVRASDGKSSMFSWNTQTAVVKFEREGKWY
jgi:hypothetical protein